jgi:hypothetical protein
MLRCSLSRGKLIVLKEMGMNIAGNALNFGA